MTIKPIETNYAGCRFRSRLEARWAVFFDALGIAWEYEREGFDLGDGLYYLPDFWLSKSHWFVEVKPVSPTGQDLLKIRRLDDNPPFPANGVVVVIGTPEPFGIDEDAVYDPTTGAYMGSVCCPVGNIASLLLRSEADPFDIPPIENAVRMARSARFESF
jgi:hypothetical protein